MNGQKKKHIRFILEYTASFAVLFLLIYLGFILNHRSFIWFYDGNKQHFPALLYLRDYNLFSGHFTLPMFDFSIGMGEDILTTLNFYGMGNPLTLFSVFVPKQHMEMFYDFLVAFRMYLAGLTYFLLPQQRKREGSEFSRCVAVRIFRLCSSCRGKTSLFYLADDPASPYADGGGPVSGEKKRRSVDRKCVFVCTQWILFFLYEQHLCVPVRIDLGICR